MGACCDDMRRKFYHPGAVWSLSWTPLPANDISGRFKNDISGQFK